MAAKAQDVTGQWYGTWVSPDFLTGRWASESYPTGSILEVSIIDAGGPLFASLYLPELGAFDAFVPAAVIGDTLVLGPPASPFGAGTINGDSMAGFAFFPVQGDPGNLLFLTWQVQRPVVPDPGLPSGAVCDHGVAAFCAADSAVCTSLVQFDPPEGIGYLDYLVGDEEEGNQFRSWLRKDLRQLVEFSAAELQCQAEGWDFGIDAPLGLGDSSLADGTSPPGHISHTDGTHIDIAYPQLYSTDNLLRPVGRYAPVPFPGLAYLIGAPSALDPYRAAMFIAQLGKHPALWYIAVDEQAGLSIENAFVELESGGWLPFGTRDSIQLLYGDQVTSGHMDHMHVALRPLEPIIAGIEFAPQTLNRKQNGRFLTAYIEPVAGVSAGEIDVETVTLIADGITLIPADSQRVEVADFNGNGAAELMVKFESAILSDVLLPGDVEMAITGAADGVYFQESALIRVK